MDAGLATKRPVKIIYKEPEKSVSVFRIYTIYDKDTGYWTALSNEIPGFVAEADSYDNLVTEIKTTAEECIELNNVPHFNNIELIPKRISEKEAESAGLL